MPHVDKFGIDLLTADNDLSVFQKFCSAYKKRGRNNDEQIYDMSPFTGVWLELIPNLNKNIYHFLAHYSLCCCCAKKPNFNQPTNGNAVCFHFGELWSHLSQILAISLTAVNQIFFLTYHCVRDIGGSCWTLLFTLNETVIKITQQKCLNDYISEMQI